MSGVFTSSGVHLQGMIISVVAALIAHHGSFLCNPLVKVWVCPADGQTPILYYDRAGSGEKGTTHIHSRHKYRSPSR